MDAVFEAATKRIDEIKEELKKLEEFVGTYRKLALELRIDTLNTTGTRNPPPAAIMPVDGVWTETDKEVKATDAAPAKRVRVSDNPPSSVVIPAAIKVIREAGRPLSRKQIRDALVERGVVVNGKDPVKTMGTILWRAPDQVIQIEGMGYWPKADPPPADTMTTLILSALGD